MKQLSTFFTKTISLAFFFFLLSFNSNAQAKLAVDFIKPIQTEAASQKKHTQFSKKQKWKLRRKQFRKWKKTHRKKLGFGAGLLSIFGLLAWRRKLKKLKKRKKKARRPDDLGDGCDKFLGSLIVMGLFSLLGRWLIKTLFGIMVNYWLGLLLGLLAGAVVIGIMWLIAKAVS